MARRATWLFLLSFGTAASACSLVTSWDDVRLGAIDSDAAALIDSGAIDAGTDAVVNDAGSTVDSGGDACTPGTVICIDTAPTGTGSPAALYACTDAGVYDRPVSCLHDCVHAGADTSNDYCSCNVGDTYCGGDNVVGDPDSLYQCGVGGPPAFKEKCAISCVVHPASNDQCNL